ncbi:hypothetical protein ACLOJK_016205 [Asimina triloba]
MPILPILLILTIGAVVSQDDVPTAERDALFSLKQAFNHPLLNLSWNGFPCYLNTTNTSTWIGISCTNGRVSGISLPSFGLTGEANVNALVSLSDVSFRNNSISGGLLDLSPAVRLKYADLSFSAFGGSISAWLAGAEKLELLQLQNNRLTGGIPPFGQQSLREFNVSSNNLSGEIPQTRVLQSFGPSSYSSNPGLCGPPSPNPCKNPEVPLYAFPPA